MFTRSETRLTDPDRTLTADYDFEDPFSRSLPDSSRRANPGATVIVVISQFARSNWVSKSWTPVNPSLIQIPRTPINISPSASASQTIPSVLQTVPKKFIAHIAGLSTTPFPLMKISHGKCD